MQRKQTIAFSIVSTSFARPRVSQRRPSRRHRGSGAARRGEPATQARAPELTSYGGLELLHRYVRRLGLYPRLRRACADLGGDYGGARLSLLLLALFYVGARRVEHLKYLVGDSLVHDSAGWAGCPRRARSRIGCAGSRTRRSGRWSTSNHPVGRLGLWRLG